MRLAFLAPEFFPPWGGVGTYSIQLIKHLSRMKGMDVHVFTPRRGKDYDAQKVLDFFDDKITLHNISDANDTFVYNFHFQKAVGKRFAEFDRKYHYDLIHSANLVHMPDILLKFNPPKIPSVVTAHTTIKGQVAGFLQGNKNILKMATSEKGSIALFPLIASLEWYYLKKTPYLLTPSQTFADIFRKKGYRGDIRVVNNGIDTDLFNTAKVKRGLSRFPKIKASGPYVLYAGRIISQKGIGLFVSMMDRLIRQGSKAHFIIAGHGDVENLKKLLSEYTIPPDRYTFLGFVPNHELPWLYEACDVFALPSFYENFPISIMEAMAMRCAPVATDVGAVKELIEEGKDGFIVPAGDIDALTKRVGELLADKPLRDRLGKAAERKIRTRLSAKRMAQLTKDYYEEIIANN